MLDKSIALILYFNGPMFAVESPSEVFQRLRNYVDALNCSALPSFAPKRLKQGFDNEMINEASDKLKINKVSICDLLCYCYRLFSLLSLYL